MNAADMRMYLSQTDIQFEIRFGEWAKCGLPLAQRVELGEILLRSMTQDEKVCHQKLVAMVEGRLRVWRPCLSRTDLTQHPAS